MSISEGNYMAGSDRRIRYTKQVIKESLFELMKKAHLRKSRRCAFLYGTLSEIQNLLWSE